MRLISSFPLAVSHPLISEELTCTRSLEEIDKIGCGNEKWTVIEQEVTVRGRMTVEEKMRDSAGCRRENGESGGLEIDTINHHEKSICSTLRYVVLPIL